MDWNYIPQGHCYLWQRSLVGLHGISDLLIALAYYSIPVLLIYFVRKREDLPFKPILWLFCAFIIACGTTHWWEVVTLWYPFYWISGFLKASTALVSIYTVAMLVPVIPKAIALPSPEALQTEITARKEAEAQVRQLNAELEAKVAERTAELEAMYQASPLGMFMTNPEGYCQFVNAMYTRIAGIRATEAQGYGWAEAIHPDDRDRVFRGWKQATEAEASYQTIYALSRATHLKNKQGQVIRMIGAHTDITEQVIIQCVNRLVLNLC